MTATKEEAARVVADLIAEAEAQTLTQPGRRAAQNLYEAAATVERVYQIGHFAESEGC